MKKKQNILYLKKDIKFLFLIFFIFFSANSSLAENPFLSNKLPRGNPYSPAKRTVLIVFDASSSMEEKINGETKIHIAKRVLEDVLTNADKNINLGFRVYGSKKPTGNQYIDCSDSRIAVIPGTENRRLIISEAYKILPQGLTPITYSLSQAVQDLIPYKGEKSIILISDGLETCGGDPCQLSQNIIMANIDLKIDVVGFGVRDDYDAQEQLMCIALSTHGKYFAANSAEELTRGLTETINKSVTGRLITMFGPPVEVESEETEGYENLPKLEPEKVFIKKKR